MTDLKTLEMKCVKDLVADSEVASPVVSKRSFEYNLNDKSAKTKLLKSAKRKPFEIVEHSTSSTLVFSPGAWNQVVQPSVKYWKSIQGDKTCIDGHIIVKVEKMLGKITLILSLFFIQTEIRLYVHCTTLHIASSLMVMAKLN